MDFNSFLLGILFACLVGFVFSFSILFLIIVLYIRQSRRNAAAMFNIALNDEDKAKAHLQMIQQTYPSDTNTNANNNNSGKKEKKLRVPLYSSMKGWCRLSTGPFLPPKGDPQSVDLAAHVSSIKASAGTGKASHLPKEIKYLIFKNGNLFIYESEETNDVCLGVTALQDDWEITLVYPPEHIPQLQLQSESVLDDKGAEDKVVVSSGRQEEAYKKEYPIKIHSSAGTAVYERSPTLYLYAATNSEKENWYLTLLETLSQRNTVSSPSSSPSCASDKKIKLPTTFNSKRNEFIQDELFPYMRSLMKSVRSPMLDQPSQWLNALLGRFYFNRFKSPRLKSSLISKINRKISFLRMPGFLPTGLQVVDVEPGNALPLVSNAQLHSIEDNGELAISMDLLYSGSFSLSVSSTARFDIPKTNKSVTWPLKVSIVLKSLSGKLLIKLKAPPSDRLWFGFYQPPTLDLQIIHQESSKAFGWSVVNSLLRKKLTDSINEIFVLPSMDEVVFNSTEFPEMSLDEHPEISILQEETINELQQQQKLEKQNGTPLNPGKVAPSWAGVSSKTAPTAGRDEKDQSSSSKIQVSAAIFSQVNSSKEQSHSTSSLLSASSSQNKSLRERRRVETADEISTSLSPSSSPSFSPSIETLSGLETFILATETTKKEKESSKSSFSAFKQYWNSSSSK